MLIIKNLEKTASKKLLLTNVNINLHEGEIFAVVGEHIGTFIGDTRFGLTFNCNITNDLGVFPAGSEASQINDLTNGARSMALSKKRRQLLRCSRQSLASMKRPPPSRFEFAPHASTVFKAWQ